MKFTEVFKMMKKGAKAKTSVMGWLLVLGFRKRNDYDAYQGQ